MSERASCPSCGSALGSSATLCPACGQPVAASSPVRLDKSRSSSGNVSLTKVGAVPALTYSSSSQSPFRQAPATPTAEERPRRKKQGLIAVGIGLALVVGVIGLVLTMSMTNDPEGRAQQEGAGASTSAGDASEGSAGQADADRVCWTGRPGADGRCDIPVDRRDVLKSAFPLDWSACGRDAGTEYNGISFSCVVDGQMLHVATYNSKEERIARLTQYGFPQECEKLSQGRMRCGPTPQGRVVLTYQNPDIRLYASSRSPSVLAALPQRPARELLQGARS